jgi:hypothetical protein
MNPNKVLGVIFLLVVAALVAPLTVVAMSTSSISRDPLRSVAISPADAAQRFTAALGQNKGVLAAATSPGAPRVSAAIDGAFETFYQVDSPEGSGFVDVHSGRIIGMAYLGSLPTTKQVLISSAQAEQIAGDFLTSLAVPTTGLTAVVTLVDHGDSCEYQVAWTEHVGDVLVPDNRSVSVNPETGVVFGFQDHRHPYSQPAAAKVSKAAAIATAISTVAPDGDATATADLQVVFDLSGNQYLLWQVEVTSYIGPPSSSIRPSDLTLVRVDAISGSASTAN